MCSSPPFYESWAAAPGLDRFRSPSALKTAQVSAAQGRLDPVQAAEQHGVQLVDLVVQVRDLELGLQVDLVVDVGADAVLGRLPVLAEQHDHRQEDRLERDAHRQQAERKRIEGGQARYGVEP